MPGYGNSMGSMSFRNRGMVSSRKEDFEGAQVLLKGPGMKILYPYAKVMGLFFPVGKLRNGGSCEFITEKCCIECYACSLDTDMGVESELKKQIYEYFVKTSSNRIAEQILKELKEANCNIFTWFASGDCPSKLTNKFYAIVKKLDIAGIIQTGFTRNEKLWKKCKNLSKSRILLTIENIDDQLVPGWYSLPNYKIGAIDIVEVGIGNVRVSVGCGGGYYEEHIKILGKDTSHLKLDCNACYKNKTGCFIITETIS